MASVPILSVQIEGIQGALKELNTIDPKYRRLVTRQIKAAGADIINDARSMVAHFDNSLENGAPLSGMVRGNIIKGRETSWKTDQVQKGFKVKVGVRATKERYVNFQRGGIPSGSKGRGTLGTYTEQVVYGAKPYQLMVIQQADAAGAIYDHAGRNTNSTFVTNLDAEVGPEPRAIDKAVERGREPVTKKVYEVVQDVEKQINRNLRFTYGN
jgi:hypothetical protein